MDEVSGPDVAGSTGYEKKLDAKTRKHTLSLSLTPSPTPTLFKNLFTDDTPTPTRFLNALDSDLIRELTSDNPFEATFRKANSSNAGDSFVVPDSSSLLSGLPDSEVLNTPSIVLPNEPDTPLILRSPFGKRKTGLGIETPSFDENVPDSLPVSTAEPPPEEISYPSDVICDLNVSSSTLTTLEDGSVVIFEGQSPEKSLNVVQTPVITSVGNSSSLKANQSAGAPTAVVVSRTTPNIVRNINPAPIPASTEKPSQITITEQPPAVVQSVCVTPMLQLMIRLPDGQTMPVQFPVISSTPAAAPVMATNVVHPTSAVTSSQPAEYQVPTSTSAAKMKLKAALVSNHKNAAANKTTAIPRNKKTKQPIPILPEDDSMNEYSLSPPNSPSALQRHGSRKRREMSDDPDEKRIKSLERNRAAATRCREKRKMWINSLEQKADELAATNVQLQHEVTQLRNEVAQLKVMLLAHKDCPVTLQQKGIAYAAEKESYTAVHVVNLLKEDVRRVPNSSIASSLKAEYMEMEINSVQSISDASLTSDNSDASFKER